MWSILLLPTLACANSVELSEYQRISKQLHAWLTDQSTLLTDFEPTETNGIATKKHIENGIEIAYRQSAKQCIAYAPHRFYDKHTYIIASALYKQQCNAFIANKVHRNTLTKSGIKADLGKYNQSVANAFIEQYEAQVGAITIYQIHGFAANKRRTAIAQQADVILSQGSKPPSVKAFKISDCLSSTVDFNSVVYPQQVNELGGTKNILNYILTTSSEFFHIEISDKARKRLIEQPKLMSQFNICITL